MTTPLIPPALLQQAGLVSDRNTSAAPERFVGEVVASKPAADGQSLVTLKVGNEKLQVMSERPLANGSQLTLQLQPDQQLDVVDVRPPAANGQTPTTNSVSAALASAIERLLASRQGLLADTAGKPAVATNPLTYSQTTISNGTASPRSNVTATALNQLVQLLANSASNSATQAAPSANNSLTPTQLQNFLQQLPTAAEPTPARVQNAIQQSGVFHEQQLLKQLGNHQSTTPAPTSTTTVATATDPATGTATSNRQANNWFQAALQGLGINSRLTQPGQPDSAGISQPTAPLNTGTAAAQPSPQASITTNSLPPGTDIQQNLASQGQQYNQRLQAAVAELALTKPEATPTNLKTILTLALAASGGLPTDQNQQPLPLKDGINGFHGNELTRLLHSALATIEHNQISMRQATEHSLLKTLLLFQHGDELQQAELELRHPAEQRSTEQRPADPRDGSWAAQNGLPQSHADNHQQTSSDADKPVANHNQQRIWQLKLHFDLADYGPLDVEVSLGWPAITVTFWSLQQHTRQSLQQQLQPLRQRLETLGAKVEQLEVRHGALPVQQHNQISQRLVDVRT
ncbi:flagellar hook-length control protein FliK [Oceanobacter mangrovi]|uniref:flagellar hook-length control protein FliK n=1 Tax=Oceanobacter mangrovi TaxID=2862510 RepID=UPI001C8E53C2|nr:flagellar hook-length control protein FliK [Oceanobacter mangrovi]